MLNSQLETFLQYIHVPKSKLLGDLQGSTPMFVIQLAGIINIFPIVSSSKFHIFTWQQRENDISQCTVVADFGK